MDGQGDSPTSPTSPIDVLVAATAGRRASLGARPCNSRLSLSLGGVPEHSVAPSNASDSLMERSNVLDGWKSGSLVGSPTAAKGGLGGDRLLSGVPVHDLFLLTNDPLLQQRVAQADQDQKGRLSRADILKVLQSEATAKQKLKWGLLIGGVLLVFCLLMLAANAGLTYAVVSMSKETSVQTSGVMTNKDGSAVVGTAQAAEIADLLYAYHTPAESASSLLSLKQLLITTDNGSVAAYSVLSATLVPGERLEFVVAAPSGLASQGPTPGTPPAAELTRIVVSAAGLHEVRGGSVGDSAGGSGRRLLQQLSGGQSSGTGIQGLLTSTANSCGLSGGYCPSSTTSGVSCPAVPTCGANRVKYGSPCEARLAGTSVLCTNCGEPCPDPATYRPPGLPPNLSWDGPGYVRTSPPPPGGSTGAASATGAPDGTGAPSKPPSQGIGNGGSPSSGHRPAGWPGNLAIDGEGFLRSPPPPSNGPGPGNGNGQGDGSDEAATAASGNTGNPKPPSPKPKPPPPSPKPKPPPPKPKPKSPPPKPKSKTPPPKPKPKPPPPRPRPPQPKKSPPPPKKAA